MAESGTRDGRSRDAVRFWRRLALPGACLAVGGGFAGLGWAGVTENMIAAALFGVLFAAGFYVIAGTLGTGAPPRQGGGR